MRRILIDTDTGGDDAVALVMALRDPSVKVEAVTTVMGNVNTDQATINALISIEKAGTYAPPVYKGLTNGVINEPLVGKDYTIHGRDGMGDLGLPMPQLKIEEEHAVDFLIRYIEENPGELELITLGPVTNIAWVALRSPGTLAKLKRITMMMGTGPYFGNATPLSEGNARMDPEALAIVLREAKTDIVLAGWNLCINEYLFRQDDLDKLRNSGSELARWCVDINHNLIELNALRFKEDVLDMADPVAMAVALDPSLVTESVTAYTQVETNNGLAYGAIAVDHIGQSRKKPNATTIVSIDGPRMKEFIHKLLI